MKIIIFAIICSAWLNTAFTQNTATDKTTTQSIESIKVPEFTDPEVKTFFISYHAQRAGFLKAVRQNNKPAIKAAFEKDVANADKITKMVEKTKASGTAEHGKLLNYIQKLIPFTNEINQSPYVKELSKEYLKNYQKNK
jgi:hypothetical protein